MSSVVPYRPPAALVQAPSQPLAEHTGWLANLQVAAEVARAVADTDFVPGWCRHNAPAVTAVIMYGLEVGLGPMAALRGVVMIDGRPSLYAETQRALILAKGHELWLEESTASKATWVGRRRNEERVTRMSFTIEEARTARIAAKQVWQAYGRFMLSARSSAALARAIFPDVIGGLDAAEEFDVVPDALGQPVDEPPTTSRARTPTSRARRDTTAAGARAQPAQDPPATPATSVPQQAQSPYEMGERPSLPGDEPSAPPRRPVFEPRSEPQMRKIHALLRERGITARDAKLERCAEIVERPLSSSSELSSADASLIIDTLEDDDSLEPVGEEARAQWLDATWRTLDPTDRELLSVALIQSGRADVGDTIDGSRFATLFPDLKPEQGDTLATAYARLLAAAQQPLEQRPRSTQGALDPPPRRRSPRPRSAAPPAAAAVEGPPPPPNPPPGGRVDEQHVPRRSRRSAARRGRAAAARAGRRRRARRAARRRLDDPAGRPHRSRHAARAPRLHRAASRVRHQPARRRAAAPLPRGADVAADPRRARPSRRCRPQKG